MGGNDPDWVGWEQSYNCGNEKAMHETIARLAMKSKRRGVIYYSASGAFRPDKCEVTPPGTIPYSSIEWTPSAAGIDECRLAPVRQKMKLP